MKNSILKEGKRINSIVKMIEFSLISGKESGSIEGTTEIVGNEFRRGELKINRENRDAVCSEDITEIKLETPCFFKYTKLGLQPHTLPDIAAKDTNAAVYQLNLENFMEDEKMPFLKYEKGINEFVGMDEKGISLLNIMDPLTKNRQYIPSNQFISIQTKAGIRKLTPELYAKVLDSFKPDIYIGMADFIYRSGNELADVSKKRIEKSVERSIKWLDANLQLNKGSVFGCLMGFTNKESRIAYAQELSKRNIGGLTLVDNMIPMDVKQQIELAKVSFSVLNNELPRFMPLTSSPDQVVYSISHGIDIFLSTYPYAVTEQGFASTYSFLISDENKVTKKKETKIDLWKPEYASDFSPLLQGCQCFTCKNHTKAYIYHLLACQEMLATVLLQIHNMQVYSVFFDEIRSSISNGTFSADSKEFLEFYGSPILTSQIADKPFPNGTEVTNSPFNELALLLSQTATPTTKEKVKRFTADS